VAELVDAADLKSVGRKAVPVRFRPSAPLRKPPLSAVFLFSKINFYSDFKAQIPSYEYQILSIPSQNE
jgi:hypothetical protein